MKIFINYKKQKKFLEALKIYKLQLKQNRTNLPFYNIGCLFLDLGRIKTAHYYFNKSKEIKADDYTNLNNLSLFRANIHLIENVKIFTEINKQIFDSIISKFKSDNQISIEDLNLDKQLLDKINKFAPIKHIIKNKPKNDNQVIELLDDISKDLFNHGLELRIQELESKFSEDMSETTFNKLKELKNERKSN